MSRRVHFGNRPLAAFVCVYLFTLSARARSPFGPQIQTTPSANMSYDPGTGVFQYTNPDSAEDFAGVPLAGTAANLVTNAAGWTASINVNIAARSMGGAVDQAPFVYLGLGVYSGNVSQNRFVIEVGQVNNTAGDDSNDVPNGFYGTAVRCSALTNGNSDATTPLGNSQAISPTSVYSILSGSIGAANTPAGESIGAAAGVLTLSYNAPTKTLTGYYNGIPVASYSPSGWGVNPPATLVVFGASEEGATVGTNTDTANYFSVAATSQSTFGPQVQSTNTAGLTYTSGTGAFQYTDTATPSEDYAYLPLAGSSAALITSSNGWIASLIANLSARTMTVTSGGSAHAVMGLVLLSGAFPDDVVFIFSAQDNDTGGGDDSIYPDGWYGTAVRFGAITNGAPDATTLLGSSLPSSNGSVYLPLSGGTNATPATESFSDVNGLLTLVYNPAIKTVTGYYNGTPVGSYSLAHWGSSPPLTLAVWGGSGSGVNVPAATDTALDLSATVTLPPVVLSSPRLSSNGTNLTFLVSGPASGSFVLQVSTNLSNWSPVSTSTIPVSGTITLSNAVSGAGRRFYQGYLQ